MAAARWTRLRAGRRPAWDRATALSWRRRNVRRRRRALTAAVDGRALQFRGCESFAANSMRDSMSSFSRKRAQPAGMLEAEQQFRKVIGYRDLAKLAIAVERDLTAKTHPSPTTEQAATLVTA